jgi:hypothetical protein
MSITQLEFEYLILTSKEEEEIAWDERIKQNCRKARLMLHLGKELLKDIKEINRKEKTP